MTERIFAGWLEECLSALGRARVAVFGDFCLDAYWTLDAGAEERSIEMGRPVRRVREQRYGLGGAGNIVANLLALGVGQVRAVGLVGRDLFGTELLRLLDSPRVNREGMLDCQDDWQTQVYCKPHVIDMEQDRIDFGGFNEIAPGTVEALGGALEAAAAESDVVVLNQQVPAGVSTPDMIRRINAVVAAHPKTIFIADSRHRAEMYRGVILKLNAHEAARLLGKAATAGDRIPASLARELAEQLSMRTGKPVFLTRGENGLLVADGRELHEAPGIRIEGPTDPVGAGDTALTALAAALAVGRSLAQAATLANIAASVTVRKLRTTGTASPAEIRAVGEGLLCVRRPEED
jgi:rfaE bifunctional protein kinase chain/domain